MKRIVLLIITAMIVLPALSQDAKTAKQTKKEERRLKIGAIAKQEEEGVIKYKKHTAVGVKLTTDGYGGFIEVLRAQSVKKALLFQLDIAERKHPKEEKSQYANNYTFLSGPILYGKQNFFYPIKLGVQEQFLLGNKGNKNGIAITGNAGGGFIAGLLRPYMIEIQKDQSTEYIGYDEQDTAFTFLDPSNFLRGPSFGTGWNKLKVTPGVYLKTGVRFDFGKYNEMVNALEVGVTGEFYSKKIPQMVLIKERQFFFSAYISLIFGKRK